MEKHTKTLLKQRRDLKERVSMNHVEKTPAYAQIEKSLSEVQANPKDLEDEVTDGRQWAMKKILDHREPDDGS